MNDTYLPNLMITESKLFRNNILAHKAVFKRTLMDDSYYSESLQRTS